ncbi:MAG: ATP-binding cassette domain-containing protein [Clostridiales bacterium]|jgi:lipopolysaccharide transport system ATP-binding protein|nr:ATP-binding cassette domain-containing protein [Clostridiales bacterium]
MTDRTLEIDGVSKRYRLGSIGGRTLHGDLTSWFARVRGKEDPNLKIGASPRPSANATFMALDGVSFSADRGDALGILGRNGAGKSTLLKLISRITAPTEGEIRIRGRVASLLEIGTGFHHELTGRENVYLNGAILGMSRAEITSKIGEIIEFSEIEQFIDTPVKRYSSGMYVKLAFAVAAHLDPDVLICDEVLAVGDLTFQQKCLGKMSDVARGGRTVLYVSHNMRTVNQLCSRAIYLERGKLLYDGGVARAIDLYAGSGLRTVDRDLDGMPRGKLQGLLIRMLSMRILGSETMEYQMDDVMEFQVRFRSDAQESRLRLRLMLKNNSSSPVAMTQTEAFEVKPGDRPTLTIRFPLEGIAPGEYGIKLALVGGDPRGRSANYDLIEDVGHFIITDDPSRTEGFLWQEPVWGNFRLGRLEMEIK